MGKAPDRYRTLTAFVSCAAPAALIVIVLTLLQQAMPAISRFGPTFLVRTAWNPVTLDFGALPYIYGTVVSSAVALAIALPVGLAVSLFLAEPGAQGIRGAIGTGIELLAAIPSVVFGIWALYVLAPFSLHNLESPVTQRLGFIGFLSGPARQTSLGLSPSTICCMA